MALRWVITDAELSAAPMERDTSVPFLVMTTFVWYGGAMLAMRARSGSDARVGADTVSVTRADWASMVVRKTTIFLWLCLAPSVWVI